ncbi:hypothetical protein B7486_60240, partial [cyanobacterium TDX16]
MPTSHRLRHGPTLSSGSPSSAATGVRVGWLDGQQDMEPSLHHAAVPPRHRRGPHVLVGGGGGSVRDALQEAREVGDELHQVTAVLADLDPERTIVVVERLIDVASDAARAAGLVP